MLFFSSFYPVFFYSIFVKRSCSLLSIVRGKKQYTSVVLKVCQCWNLFGKSDV